MATDLPAQLCPQCQHPLEQGATACPNCGQVISGASDTMEATAPAPAEAAPPPSGEADATLGDAENLEATGPGESAASSPDSAPAPDDAPAPPAAQAAPASQRVSRRLKIALVAAAALIILSVTGAGIAYALTRPQPLITVTSDYHLGNVPAGSASTALHIVGQQFASNSAITFLLDGRPAPDSQIVPSDDDGAFEADLTVTGRWKMGTHQLTARDANGNTTRSSVKVMVVHQGEAHTPGPNGAPADDTSHFTLYVTIVVQELTVAGIPVDLGGSGSTVTLTIQGRPDPAGGAVCDLQKDDGKTHTEDLSFVAFSGTGIVFRPGSGSFISLQKLSTAYTCSGLYQGAKISFTETNTIYKEVYSNGITCNLVAPRVSYQLTGAFNSAATATGTYSVPASSVKCSNGRSELTPAETGTWTGILSA